MASRLSTAIRNVISPKGLTGRKRSSSSARTVSELGVGQRRKKRIDEAVRRSVRGK